MGRPWAPAVFAGGHCSSPRGLTCGSNPYAETWTRRLMKASNEGGMDAVVLAAAGLQRLGRGDAISEYFEPEHFIPAVGQGRYRHRDPRTPDRRYGTCPKRR